MAFGDELGYLKVTISGTWMGVLVLLGVSIGMMIYRIQDGNYCLWVG